jgi:hypothetical protein
MIHLGRPVPILDIDDAEEAIGTLLPLEYDFDCNDAGNSFEACPGADNGHLFKTHCGETICVHCGRVVCA